MKLKRYEITAALLAAECFDEKSIDIFHKFMDANCNGQEVSDLIGTPYRLAAFVAQLSHESAGLTKLVENANYSPERALAVFPRHIKDLTHARLLCADPRLLLNKVYGGRMGNGKNNDDGWNYRGRGYIMLTGKNNYRKFQEATGIESYTNPKLMELPALAFHCALWFFMTRRGEGKTLLELADLNRQRLISRIINGGRNGIKHRLKLVNKVKAVLSDNFAYNEEIVTPLSTRNEIKEAQFILKELGLYEYSIDGYWGPGTRKALLTFEHDNSYYSGNLFCLHDALNNHYYDQGV